jgi:putative two-component system response regulator
VIVITGISDRTANVKAIDAGADDYLTKPFDRILLEARIRASLRTKLLQDQVYEYQRNLESKVVERTRQLTKTQAVAVFSLAKLAESRDNETGDHVERVRSYARVLAESLSRLPKYQNVIGAEFIDEIYKSAPLHDIGKVGIPDRILLKPGKLSDFEFEIMKSHAKIGGDTLRAADLAAGGASFLSMARDIAYHHHEKWDGSGYPDGLVGEAIPLPARILALADVYDALSSKRPYKEAFPHEKCKAIVLAGRGSHFDPDVVNAFLDQEDAFLVIREEYVDDGAPSHIQSLVDQLETAGYCELEH